MKEKFVSCEECLGTGIITTCLYCNKDAPVYCHPSECEKAEYCEKCYGTGILTNYEEENHWEMLS